MSRAVGPRRERAATVMDAGLGEDAVSLALTLVLCAIVTVGFLLWGHPASPPR